VWIERARALLTAVQSDAGNVYITLSARALNPKLVIVARAATAEAEHKLTIAGANREWLVWSKLDELKEAWQKPLRW